MLLFQSRSSSASEPTVYGLEQGWLPRKEKTHSWSRAPIRPYSKGWRTGPICVAESAADLRACLPSISVSTITGTSGRSAKASWSVRGIGGKRHRLMDTVLDRSCAGTRAGGVATGTHTWSRRRGAGRTARPADRPRLRVGAARRHRNTRMRRPQFYRSVSSVACSR